MAKLPANITKIVIGVVVAAIVIVGVYFVAFSGSAQKKVTAQFASAVGIYPGTPVRILGVNVGTVTGVHPEGGYVRVDMTYDSKYVLPDNVTAVEVANSLVSDRYIQFAPAWNTSQATHVALRSGSTIPLNRTGGPAELDDIYAALNKLSVALGPAGANKHGALSTLLQVAAANLKGNGAALGNSITQLSKAAETLATKKDDLFGTIKNLQQFTLTLQNSDSAIRTFNQQLAQVASDLASERSDLGGALHQLGQALDSVATFVKQNASHFHTDIQGLNSLLTTLDNQKASLNETLAVAPVALANLIHLYDPNLGTLGTRSNLASLTTINANTVTGLVCGLLGKALGGLTGSLLKQCGGSSSSSSGSSSSTTVPGLGIPGLIGGGS